MTKSPKTAQQLEWERQRELAASLTWPFPPEWPWTTATRVSTRVKAAWRRVMNMRPKDERISLKMFARTYSNGYCARWLRLKGCAQ
jgi:hypothetical protein